METENKDWKPEVGKTAWAVNRRSLAVVECVINAIYGTDPYVVADVSSRTRGGSWLDKAMVVYPTAESALAANPLKVYDLEGKEVVIPRADQNLAEMALTLKMENDLLRKPVTTLAQAQMLLYEHGMMVDLSGLSPILIERGGAAIGGKSDAREGGY